MIRLSCFSCTLFNRGFLQFMPDLDSVTLSVLKGRLEQIADEMDATLFRSAFNPIIAEAHDASHGLYHAKTGETLVQGKSGLPIFVGTMAFAVRLVIDRIDATDTPLTSGDIYIFNDPYEGGTHLSDFKLVRPISIGVNCSVSWPRWGTGTMSVAMCPVITTPQRPRASRKAC